MKILIVLVRMKGGVGRVALAQKKELERLGHQVEILSREDDLGIPFNSGGFIFKYFKLRKEVKKRDYDILYTQDWSCTLPCLFYKNVYSCFHGHNPEGLARFLQTLVGTVMGKRLFVVGDSLKERFPKATLNYNGVDKEEFYDLNKERKYFGWIKTPYEEITEEEVKEIAKEYKLQLVIPKDILPVKMNEWYNSLKVFASYPPYYTGFNLCWLEAKEAGVPIILGNENGMKVSRVKDNNHINIFNWKSNVKILLEVFNKLK